MTGTRQRLGGEPLCEAPKRARDCRKLLQGGVKVKPVLQWKPQDTGNGMECTLGRSACKEWNQTKRKMCGAGIKAEEQDFTSPLEGKLRDTGAIGFRVYLLGFGPVFSDNFSL